MRSYEETVNYIANLRGGEIDLRLHRVERALAPFALPHTRYAAFHIAGTNGKGSTAAILHRILCEQGYRAGLYTSPHLASFTERIRVNDEEIGRDEVVELAKRIEQRTAGAGVQLTFFEFVTVMGFVYFAEKQIDVAVVEVGLGGRLDATNVVSPVAALITTISMDHEAYLGSDLLSIAREKGGIIKPGVPVVCGAVPAEAQALYRDMAAARNAPVFFLGKDFTVALKAEEKFDYSGRRWKYSDLTLGLPGNFQRQNAAVALAGLEAAAERFPMSEAALRAGLENVRWPGRLEFVQRAPQVILDGAHNEEGVNTLVQEIERLLPGRKVKLLFGAMRDKNWRTMLGRLCAIAEEVVLARVPMERSADPKELAAAVPETLPARTSESPLEGLRCLLAEARPSDTILVAGSLYLLGEVRPYFFSGDIIGQRSRT
ncbi:MAG TPA: folylpolyglutamate synthase/dihydrofolate synthase family protein [Candidatus Acidoferrales bacterium]|nr:folylpolyglutamate synthase/dihydrofolate synthase family protein [Candidatus Acidoferrales bacterium]